MEGGGGMNTIIHSFPGKVDFGPEERLRFASQIFEELKSLGKNVKFTEILKSMQKRDREDRTRKHSRLKKTRDSYLINTTNLSIKSSFLKVKKIIDKKLNKIWKK